MLRSLRRVSQLERHETDAALQRSVAAAQEALASCHACCQDACPVHPGRLKRRPRTLDRLRKHGCTFVRYEPNAVEPRSSIGRAFEHEPRAQEDWHAIHVLLPALQGGEMSSRCTGERLGRLTPPRLTMASFHGVALRVASRMLPAISNSIRQRD